MVKGLDLFRDWFSEFTDCYTLIGGGACDLWMGERGLEFRATKDLDIVLAFEGQRAGFVKHFWAFVKAGEYAGYQASETPSNFYRFHKPRTAGFPAKLEICARRPMEAPANLRVMRIPAGEDVSSLSAILLDSEYYDLVYNDRRVIEGVSTVSGACLIPLKVKAWLTLSANKAGGRHVDQKDIDKHRNDVFRLLLSLAPADKLVLADAIRTDLQTFIDRLPPDSRDWVGIRAALASNKLTLPPVRETIAAFKTLHGLN
jgi:hypothetical protein